LKSRNTTFFIVLFFSFFLFDVNNHNNPKFILASALSMALLLGFYFVFSRHFAAAQAHIHPDPYILPRLPRVTDILCSFP
jgi:hypothetical protein